MCRFSTSSALVHVYVGNVRSWERSCISVCTEAHTGSAQQHTGPRARVSGPTGRPAVVAARYSATALRLCGLLHSPVPVQARAGGQGEGRRVWLRSTCASTLLRTCRGYSQTRSSDTERGTRILLAWLVHREPYSRRYDQGYATGILICRLCTVVPTARGTPADPPYISGGGGRVYIPIRWSLKLAAWLPTLYTFFPTARPTQPDRAVD